MKANPFVLIATLVVGVATAMWALRDSTTAAERAQQKYGEILEKNAEKNKTFKSRTEELISVLKDETATLNQRIKAYKELQSLNPQFKEVSLEEIERLSQIELQVMVNLSVDNQELELAKKELDDAEKLLLSHKNRLRKLLEEDKVKNASLLGAAPVTAPFVVGAMLLIKKSAAEDDIEQQAKMVSQLKKHYDSLLESRKEAEFATKPSEERLRILNEEKDALEAQKRAILEANPELEGIIDGTGKARDNVVGLNAAWVDFDFQSANNLSILTSIGKKIAEITSRITGINNGGDGTKETFLQAYSKAEAQYKEKQKALNDITRNRGKYSVDDYKKAKDEAAKAKRAFEELGGGASSRANKEQPDYSDLLQLRRKNQQDEIDLMKEGTDKKLKQIDLDYQKEFGAVKKQEEEWSRKNGGKLTDQQSVEILTAYTNVEKRKDKRIEDVNKEQLSAEEEAMNKYLKAYGTFQEKKEAIEEEYADKKSKATTEGEKLSLEKQMEKELQSLDMEKLKQDINWEAIFGDLGNASKKSLNDVKKQLKDFKDLEAYDKMSVDQKAVIDEALSKIQTSFINKGGLLGNLPEQLEAFRIAQEELTQAQKEYNEAMSSGTDAEKEAATKKKNAAQNKARNAETNVNTSTNKTVDNLITLSDALVQLGSSSEMSLSQMGGLAKNITDIFTEAGSKVGGIIEAAFSLLDVISKQGLDGFVKNVFSSLASVQVSIWDTMTFGGFSKITGSGESDKTLQQDLEYLTQSNQDLKQAIDKLTDVMDDSPVAEATDVYKRLKGLKMAQETNTQEMMQRSGAAHKSGIAGNHSSNYYIDKSMSQSDWARISAIVGHTVKGSGDFWNLTSEQMAMVATQATDLYTKIKQHGDDGHANASQYMDAYIKYYEELEALDTRWREKITSASFDTIRDDFKKALMDMESDAADFAANFEELMKKALFESLMDNYDDRLNEWYKNFAKAMEDGSLEEKIQIEDEKGNVKDEITEQEFLKQEWDKIVNDGIADRDTLYNTMGWDRPDGEEERREASSKGFASMSQDSADELNGRFTAMQYTAEQIRLINSMTQVDVAELKRIGASASETLADLRQIGLDTVFYLEKISNNTDELYMMNERLGSMKSSLDDMNLKGVTIKR